MQSLTDLITDKTILNFDSISPNGTAFVLMLLTSLLFGIMLNILYGIYFRESEPIDASLSRSLVLLTPSLMTFFWVVQYSLPLSVGLIGTLSFVRFRSPVKRAEDISFIVIALACAISCAISKPFIGGLLISIFLCYSIFRNYFVPRLLSGTNFAVVTYNTKKDIKASDIERLFTKANCRHFEFVSARTYDGITSFVFNISHLTKWKLTTITDSLKKADTHSNINIFYPNGRLGI